MAPVAEWLRSLISFDQIIVVSSAGSSPAQGIYQTSQVLLSFVSGAFSWDSLDFVSPTDYLV